jgi:Na+-transporting NADH:ubiquinone oxidoreductase subunit NqrD
MNHLLPREFGESSFAKKSFDVIGVNFTTIYNFQQFFISLLRISPRHLRVILMLIVTVNVKIRFKINSMLRTYIYVVCLVYPMFPVSLGYPFLIAPSVSSNV